VSITEPTAAEHDFGPEWKNQMVRQAMDGARAAMELAGLPPLPRIVCLCGSTRFYDAFQAANYERTMAGEIVLSVGFYPHAKAEHGHGEGVGHDSAEKVSLDELHKRKVDLADYVLVVSDETGYFGESTAGEIAYAVAQDKPIRFAVAASLQRALEAGLLGMSAGVPCGCGPDERCFECATDEEAAAAIPPFPLGGAS
jgi:hypothetical protein